MEMVLLLKPAPGKGGVFGRLWSHSSIARLDNGAKVGGWPWP